MFSALAKGGLSYCPVYLNGRVMSSAEFYQFGHAIRST
jgi:hypothetical protein